MGFMDKVKDLAKGRGKQIDQGIDKVADVIDDKTGGKHADKIDQAAEKAKDLADKLDDDPKA
ncbi:MAG: antitoxin [Actinomycetota bacterium]